MIGLLAGLCASSSTFAQDAVPTGTLNVDRTLVRAGTQCQLDWKITYPKTPAVGPNLIPTGRVKMRVRLLGASFQQSRQNNGHGNNLDGVDSSNPGRGSGGPNGAIDLSAGFDDEKKTAKSVELPVEVMWSRNSAPWSCIFYGLQKSVIPTSVVLETTVEKNEKIDFGARGFRSGWLPLYSTATSTPNVLVLKDGDKLPASVTAFRQGVIEDFLVPHLAADRLTVNIGEGNLILLYELGQTSTSAPGFDLQDLVMLVTFE
ncbi:MAG: hypothetical protein ACRDBP_06365 [Luteolibacter sp.]